MNDCIFCKISEGNIPSEKIYENDNFFSIPDASPQMKGHSLVISKGHFKNVMDLPEELGEDLIDCIKKTASSIMKKFGYDGFNVVQNNFKSADQVVDHIHFHILPRKTDDGLKIGVRKKE